MQHAGLAGERMAVERAGRSGPDDGQPLEADVPLRPRRQLTEEDQAAVGILGLRSRFLDFHQQRAPEAPVAIGAAQFPDAGSPGCLEITPPDQPVVSHIEDVGEI